MTLLSRALLPQFATSSLPAFTRLGTAAFVGDGVENFKRPEKMLELYEFQGQNVGGCRHQQSVAVQSIQQAYISAQAHSAGLTRFGPRSQAAPSAGRSGRLSHFWIWTS